MRGQKTFHVIDRWSMDGHGCDVKEELDPEGPFVLFTDHERVVAEKDARIKKLEVERLKDAQFVESARDLRWRQAIEALGADRNPDWTDEENRAYAAGLRAALNALDPEPLWQEATNE